MKKKMKKESAQEETAQAIADAAKSGANIVIRRAATIQDTSIGVVERGILDDIAQHALQIGQAKLPAIITNSRFCILAAWQLGYTGKRPDFLPGEAVPTLLSTIVSIPHEDQERSALIGVSLAAMAASKTLKPQSRYSSARLHCWVSYLYGKDRQMMEKGAS